MPTTYSHPIEQKTKTRANRLHETMEGCRWVFNIWI